jgi:hypothetical protein
MTYDEARKGWKRSKSSPGSPARKRKPSGVAKLVEESCWGEGKPWGGSEEAQPRTNGSAEEAERLTIATSQVAHQNSSKQSNHVPRYERQLAEQRRVSLRLDKLRSQRRALLTSRTSQTKPGGAGEAGEPLRRASQRWMSEVGEQKGETTQC